MKRLKLQLTILLSLLSVINLAADPIDIGGVRDWEKLTRLSLERMADNLSKSLKPWVVPSRIFKVENFGAVGDGVTMNTKAIQTAIDRCSAQGGGVVVFTKGEYLTGTFEIKSGVMLEIIQGAKIIGSTNLEDYPQHIAKRQTVMDTHMEVHQSLIFAENAERIGIRGPGTIDFRGQYENFPGKETVAQLPGRPFGIRVIDCKKVVVQNVNFMNSPSWMQDYLNCEDVIIDGVNNFNQTNWNQDGLDIDGCYRVIVRNCFFNVYDDSMCFKGASLRPTEDILVENCTFYSLCNSFKFGTDSQCDFRRVLVRNVTLGGPEKSLPKKGYRTTSSTGITLMTVDGGDVEDILIKDIVINRAQCPVFIKVGNRGRLKPGMDKAPIGKLRRIIIENVTGVDNGLQGSIITGIKSGFVEDVVLRNFDIEASGGAEEKALTAEVGEHHYSYPDAFRFNQYIGLPSYACWFRYARNINLYNINVKLNKKDPRPEYGKGEIVEQIFVDGEQLY